MSITALSRFCQGAFLYAGLALAGAAQAQERPAFIFPAACILGEECWIMNYPDVDPAKDSARDFTCGARTYEGHNGTDIGLRDFAQIEKGVAVLAAAPGRVERVRDGEPDGALSEKEVETLEDRECGNGVLLDHGDGVQTLYCHLKKDSIVVKPGDSVTAGQKIAAIGQSGKAEFPHVHFEVIWDATPADPFTGAQVPGSCDAPAQMLWAGAVLPGYDPVTLYDGGFAASVPDFKAIERGQRQDPETLPPSVSPFAFWAGIFGVQEGDEIVLQILKPDGSPYVRRDIVQDRTRAKQFYFVGRKNEDGKLAPGTYTGTVRLVRAVPGGEPITRTLTRTILVE